MITRDEMYKFGDMLDKEYEDVIKPILENTHNAVESVLACIRNPKWKTMARRNNYVDVFKVGYLHNNLQNLFYTLRYRGLEINNYELLQYDTPSSLIGWMGYSEVAYTIPAIKYLFVKADKYRDNDILVVDTIKSLKKEFENIKKAYNELFVENDGVKFLEFTESVKKMYDDIVNADRKSDNELYAMFGTDAPKKTIRITVSIEEV